MRIATAATLMIRVRLASGERVYYPAAKHPNGKLKPNVALVPRGPKVRGKKQEYDEQKFAAGTYYLRSTAPDGKRIMERVSDDISPLDAQAAKRAKLHVLALDKDAVITSAAVSASATIAASTPPTERHELKKMISAFVAARSKNRRTGNAYEKDLNGLLKIVPKQYADELTRADFRLYISKMEKAAKSAKTIVNRLTTFKAFLNFFDLDASVINRKDWPKVPKKLVKVYKSEQIASLLEVSSPEDRLVWEFFLASGCREQEVMYLCWSDLDLDSEWLHIHAKPDMGFQLKDYEERSVPLPKAMVEKLKTLKLTAGKRRLVFPARNGRPEGHFLRKLKEVAYAGGLHCGHCRNRVGVECGTAAVCDKWTLHSFRRTAATGWAGKGISLPTIQKWLGHSDITTTSLYLADQEDAITRDLLNRA